jgi:hypothetical protein
VSVAAKQWWLLELPESTASGDIASWDYDIAARGYRTFIDYILENHISST